MGAVCTGMRVCWRRIDVTGARPQRGRSGRSLSLHPRRTTSGRRAAADRRRAPASRFLCACRLQRCTRRCRKARRRGGEGAGVGIVRQAIGVRAGPSPRRSRRASRWAVYESGTPVPTVRAQPRNSDARWWRDAGTPPNHTTLCVSRPRGARSGAGAAVRASLPAWPSHLARAPENGGQLLDVVVLRSGAREFNARTQSASRPSLGEGRGGDAARPPSRGTRGTPRFAPPASPSAVSPAPRGRQPTITHHAAPRRRQRACLQL